VPDEAMKIGRCRVPVSDLGRVTLSVIGLDALLERLTAQRIDHQPVAAYPNGVGHVEVPDPDGNAIALAGLRLGPALFRV
jgi:hypothetical protein